MRVPPFAQDTCSVEEVLAMPQASDAFHFLAKQQSGVVRSLRKHLLAVVILRLEGSYTSSRRRSLTPGPPLSSSFMKTIPASSSAF
jgi:hypothetical protein